MWVCVGVCGCVWVCVGVCVGVRETQMEPFMCEKRYVNMDSARVVPARDRQLGRPNLMKSKISRSASNSWNSWQPVFSYLFLCPYPTGLIYLS